MKLLNKKKETPSHKKNGRRRILYELEIDGVCYGYLPLREIIKFIPPNAEGTYAKYDTVYTRIAKDGYKNPHVLDKVMTNEEKGDIRRNAVRGNRRTAFQQAEKLSQIPVGMYDNL